LLRRGKGLVAREEIAAAAFVVEYTGEVITEKERLERMASARQRGAVHFYIMQLTRDLYIDAEHMGSNARFMNSSCEPNCETQKWKDAATGVHAGLSGSRNPNWHVCGAHVTDNFRPPQYHLSAAPHPVCAGMRALVQA
jgi:hypothetical protein